MEVWNGEVWIETDPFAFGEVLDTLKEMIDRVKSIENIIVYEDLKAEDLSLLGWSVAA